MRGLISQNHSYQLSPNNNAMQRDQKQRRKYSLSNEKLFSGLEINGRSQRRKTRENNWDIVVRRVNEYSYMVSFDKLEQETEFHSGQLILTDLHRKLLDNKEKLVTSQGFIHIKEYVIDGYECRCHEQNDLLNDKAIDNNKHSFDYKLEF